MTLANKNPETDSVSGFSMDSQIIFSELPTFLMVLQLLPNSPILAANNSNLCLPSARCAVAHALNDDDEAFLIKKMRLRFEIG
jgi:hypothetical protein